MTAPLPFASRSPIADLFNDLVAWLHARLAGREAELLDQLAAERELNFELRTARNFADSEAAGYIDRTGLERP